MVYEPKTDLVYMKYKRPSKSNRFITVQPKQLFDNFFSSTMKSKKPYPFKVYKKRPKGAHAFIIPGFETFRDLLDYKLHYRLGMKQYSIIERKSKRKKDPGYILYFWDDAEFAEFVFHYSHCIDNR